MANLGNSKIKDTYQLVLQSDASGNLQKLDGTTPSLIFNSSFKYKVGSLVDGYVLKSDSSGNVSWGAVAFSGDVYISGGSINSTTIELQTTSGATVSIPGLSWSSNTSGHISNSGLTGNIGIGTSIPNKKLTVVGDISGTTDLYLGNSTHTSSTITAQGELNIKGNGLNDYLRVSNDFFGVWMDGAQEIVVSPTETTFNASSRAVDFAVLSDDGTQLIRTRAEKNIVRLHDHVSINQPTGWNWDNEQQQALAVSGTSVFYSGGTSHNTEAIVAIGNISGTTDLYLGSSSHTTSNIIAQELLHIKGQGSGNDYMVLGEDYIDIFINGAECVAIQPNQIVLNSSTQNIDTKIMSETDGIAAIHVDANTDIVRLNRYILVNGLDTADTNQALYVSGSSLFYSGGTSISGNAITAVGAISGTTDLYIDDNIQGLRGQFGDSPVDAGPIRDLDIRNSGSTYLRLESETNANQIIEFMNNQEPDFYIQNKFGDGGLIIGSDNKQFLIIGANDDDTIDLYGNTTISGNTTLSGNTLYSGTLSGTGSVTTVGNLGVSGRTYIGTIDAAGASYSNNKLLVAQSNGEVEYLTTAELKADIADADYWSANTDGSISTSGSSTNLELGGDISLADNGQILLGNGDDLKIYHSGSHSIIQEAGAGNLLLKGGVVKIMGTTTGEDCAIFTENAGVELYYDNVKKFETTADGITTTGNTNISGDTYVLGDTYTTDLVLDGGKVRPAASGGEVIFANADHGSADWLTLSQDLFVFKLNGVEYARIEPDEFLINASSRPMDFSVLSDLGNRSIQGIAEGDLLAIGQSGGTSIGGTTSRWPTPNGQYNNEANKTLQVNGITTIYSGGTGNAWSADTTALTVVGDISGSTNLHISSISATGPLYSANHDILAGSTFKFVDLDDGFYGMPGNAGWSNTSWGNFKTNGASGLGSASQQIGITLPYKAILVGAKGVFRSNETGNYRFALWTAVLTDNVATGTWSETITTANINVLTVGRPFNFNIVDGTTEFAAGTQIIPSFFNDTGADNADIFGNYMIIIKRVE